MLIWIVWGCGGTSTPEPKPEPAPASEPAPAVEEVASVAYSRRTTAGKRAVDNLNLQIETNRRAARPESRPALQRSLLLRAQVLGSSSDLEAALELAETPAERAVALAALHRFDEALASDPDPKVVESIGLARRTGLDEIEASRRAAVEKRPHYSTHSALADVLRAQGKWKEADASYVAALDDYRDVSPFSVAGIQFTRGVMWGEQADDPDKARALYEDAVRRLPAFVVANVHLAEMEAESGDTKKALERLNRVRRSEDPEPWSRIAELETGDTAERARNEAAKRYEMLLEQHPLAYADHATEFYLGAGSDPKRALELAELNFGNRATDRSRSLLVRAAETAGAKDRACAVGRESPTPVEAGWKSLRDRLRLGCP